MNDQDDNRPVSAAGLENGDTIPDPWPPGGHRALDLAATDEKGVYLWTRVAELHRADPTRPPPQDTYVVVMELLVDADNAAEAATRAMRWRDAIGLWGGPPPDDFYWHLHHPWGC